MTGRKPVPAKAPGLRPDPHDPAAMDAAFAGLNSREWDVLELLSEGLDDNAIAARLGIGHQTVRSHATSLFGKIGATSRLHALVLAVRNRKVTIR